MQQGDHLHSNLDQMSISSRRADTQWITCNTRHQMDKAEQCLYRTSDSWRIWRTRTQ